MFVLFYILASAGKLYQAHNHSQHRDFTLVWLHANCKNFLPLKTQVETHVFSTFKFTWTSYHRKAKSSMVAKNLFSSSTCSEKVHMRRVHRDVPERNLGSVVWCNLLYHSKKVNKNAGQNTMRQIF